MTTTTVPVEAMDALEIDPAKNKEIREYAGMSIELGPPVIQAESSG
jgi:hypothetical protein